MCNFTSCFEIEMACRMSAFCRHRHHLATIKHAWPVPEDIGLETVGTCKSAAGRKSKADLGSMYSCRTFWKKPRSAAEVVGSAEARLRGIPTMSMDSNDPGLSKCKKGAKESQNVG